MFLTCLEFLFSIYFSNQSIKQYNIQYILFESEFNIQYIQSEYDLSLMRLYLITRVPTVGIIKI